MSKPKKEGPRGVIERNKLNRVVVLIHDVPVEVRDGFKAICRSQKTTMSEAVRRFINYFAKRRDDEPLSEAVAPKRATACKGDSCRVIIEGVNRNNRDFFKARCTEIGMNVRDVYVGFMVKTIDDQGRNLSSSAARVRYTKPTRGRAQTREARLGPN